MCPGFLPAVLCLERAVAKETVLVAMIFAGSEGDLTYLGGAYARGFQGRQLAPGSTVERPHVHHQLT